jgi:hypothetical protein
VPTGLEPDAAAGSTLESAAAGDDEVTSRWAPSSWRQLIYNRTQLTVPPLSMRAVRMALCFSKVMSASVPCFLTLWSLPQNWG